MSTYRNRTPSPPRSIRAPPPSTPNRRSHQNSPRYRDRDRERNYDLPSKRAASKTRSSPSRSPPRRQNGPTTLIISVFHSSSHNWSTTPVKFSPSRTNDKDLWYDVRDAYEADLRKPWARFLSLRHVTGILPVTYSPNGIPMKADVGADFPSARALRHMYHHPDQIRTKHSWVDAFAELDAKSKGAQVGLQFIEGLNADKLAILGVLATIAIIVVTIVWCVKGGDLQTVITVMGFVLTLVAAQVALVALYFQVVSNDGAASGGGGGS